MHTYRVTGVIKASFFSQWVEQPVWVEVRAGGEEEAIRSTLAIYQASAERQDPEATVVWDGAAQVEQLADVGWGI